jgi:AcrR family transcriptional regulator
MLKNNIKDNTKTQILEAALHVFVKSGYSKTTMDDIVSKSGHSKGAIYHYYSSKKDLFLALIDYWESYFFKNIINKDLSNNNPDELLRDITLDVIKTFKSSKHIFLAELEFWSLSNHDLDIRKKTTQLYSKLIDLFKTIISKGLETGLYKKIDLDVASLSVMTALQGVIWFSIFDKSDISAEKYLNDVIEFIIHGFKK